MNQSESQTLVVQRSLYILYIRFSSSTVDKEFRLYTYYSTAIRAAHVTAELKLATQFVLSVVRLTSF